MALNVWQDDNIRTLKLILMLGLVLIICACAYVDTVTRYARFEPDSPRLVEALPFVSLGGINVWVPEAFKVSERNSYLLGGDIVWGRDAPINRYKQFKVIFDMPFK